MTSIISPQPDVAYTYGDLFGEVLRRVHEHTGKEVNPETIIFYDATLHRMDYTHDAQEIDVAHHHTIHAVIINENLIGMAIDGPPEVSAQWPWVWTAEAEAWLEEDRARSLARKEVDEAMERGETGEMNKNLQ
jgi:hypothetical protein